MHHSRRTRAVHRSIVAGTALGLVACRNVPAVHAHDDPPTTPVPTSTTKSLTPAGPTVPATPAASPLRAMVPTVTPALLAPDVYIDVKAPRIVDGVSDADLGANVATVLRESLASSAKRQYIEDPTIRDKAAPKALHLTLEGEVGMIEVGEKLHRPCTLTMRLYAEGEKRQLVAQFSGMTRSSRELTRRFYPDSDTPLVTKMAPLILGAAMNAALGAMIENLTHVPNAAIEATATPRSADAPALAASLPRLNVTIQHLDQEPDTATARSGDAGQGKYTSALLNSMEVAPGHHYRVSLTSPDAGTVYLVSLNRETMLPTIVDSALLAVPNQSILLPAKEPLTSPENPDEASEQLFFAFLQKRRDAAPSTASHPAASSFAAPTFAVSPPSVPTTSKKTKQGLTVPIAVNTILSSASAPISDTLDPAIVRLVHLYTTDPEGWTAMRVSVTTTPAAPPDALPATPLAKPSALPVAKPAATPIPTTLPVAPK